MSNNKLNIKGHPATADMDYYAEVVVPVTIIV